MPFANAWVFTETKFKVNEFLTNTGNIYGLVAQRPYASKKESYEKGVTLTLYDQSLYEYGIEVRHSISLSSDDTSLKIQNAKSEVSINKEVYELIRKIPVKENGYIFGFSGFKQSEQLAELLTEFKNYLSRSERYSRIISICSRYRYCICIKKIRTYQHSNDTKLLSGIDARKKHQQDADALSLLSSL